LPRQYGQKERVTGKSLILAPTAKRHMINRMLGVGVAAMLTLVPVANGQTVAQTIYGETITEDEVDQRTKLNSLLSKQVTRQDVLGQLADDKDKIKEARDARVLPPDEYIEAFIKSRGEVLEKVLGQNGVRLDTFRSLVRADAARSSLARYRRYQYRDLPYGRLPRSH
jgi:peptidyl-prolyl cis-trans isomerase SurA